MKIGRFLRRLRLKREFSQECVAVMLGISQKKVSKVENNLADPRFSEVVNWCKSCGTTLAKLEKKCNKPKKGL